ncbi:cytochrome P450 [Nocardia cyriacigeorgica]|uniref:cytochrome P450 n=1 Tax=Nocardia cyriacigeorgica TaxID=135487 RepID=UPI00245476AF|nr:cytochrome P450 [Nocardia cyriacigeorgica]
MTLEATRAPAPNTVTGSWLFGSTMDLIRDPLGASVRGFRECGDVARFELGPPGLRRELYLINHPDGAAQILNAGTSRNFRKDGISYGPVRELFGNGLLTAQDDDWQRQRRFIQPFFTPKSVDSYAGIMADLVDRTVAEWRAVPDRLIDLRAEMGRLTLDIAGRILFGEDAASMVGAVRTSFPVLGRAVLRRAMSPVHAPLSWPTPANRRIKQAQNDIGEICEELIARRRAAAEPGSDLIGRLVSARSGDEALDDDEIRDQVKIFLLAGHETTATALMFAFRLLGMNARAQRRLWNEVRQVPAGAPRDARTAGELVYTTMVLKETTRLYPSAPFVVRKCVDEAEICGYRTPAGADLSIATWVIHHREDLWPDPERFDPQRFAPDDDQRRHKLAWMPFAFGPRGCIGQRFAMFEAAIVLAGLAREFEFVTPPGDLPISADLVLHPTGEVPCYVRKRD